MSCLFYFIKSPRFFFPRDFNMPFKTKLLQMNNGVVVFCLNLKAGNWKVAGLISTRNEP